MSAPQSDLWEIVDNGGIMREGVRVVSKPYKSRRRAQHRADKLNLEYGAHRYTARRIVAETGR